jgi:hypothetical protein
MLAMPRGEARDPRSRLMAHPVGASNWGIAFRCQRDLGSVHSDPERREKFSRRFVGTAMALLGGPCAESGAQIPSARRAASRSSADRCASEGVSDSDGGVSAAASAAEKRSIAAKSTTMRRPRRRYSSFTRVPSATRMPRRAQRHSVVGETPILRAALASGSAFIADDAAGSVRNSVRSGVVGCMATEESPRNEASK